jgi:hypothetical protein
MREDDFDTFSELLDAVAEVLPRAGGQPLNGTAKAMYFRALTAHELAAVRKALEEHVRDPQRGRFFPTPADVVAQLQVGANDDGRPGAEEAWAISLGARDERATVVWTQDMAQAWQIAKPVLSIGDEVGARMAFREAYVRLIGEARAARMPVRWVPSLGQDPRGRDAPIAAAVEAGRLPHDALPTLPAPIAPAVLALVGSMGYEARDSLKAVANELRCRVQEVAINTKERDVLNAKKAEVARQVARYTEAGKAA